MFLPFVRLAGVSWSYLRMGSTPVAERGAQWVEASYSGDDILVTASESADVMVAVVEQIATEQNRLAVDLRDQGRIDEAQLLLLQNTAYVKDKAIKYDSQTLSDVALENEADAENIVKQEEWTSQRKAMTETQLKRSKQRKQ